MRVRSSKIIAVTAVLVTVSVAIVAASIKSSTPTLPGGYYLWRSDSHSITLGSPERHYGNPTHVVSGVAVGAKITWVAVAGEFILGRVVESPGSPYRDTEVVGYFVVDSRDGDALLGLTREELFAWMERHDVDPEGLRWRRM